MILAIIESKSAGMVSPSLTPVSTRMPGPAGRFSRAIGRGTARSRGPVLGVEPGSTAWPSSARLLASRLAAGGRHAAAGYEVGAGGDLGDRCSTWRRVLTSRTRQLVAGVVEELDGARAAVADLDGQPLADA